MSITNTNTETIFDAGIIEANDQTDARAAHLKALEELVGNVYPNKFARSNVSGREDTITNILNFAPVTEIVAEIKAHIATLNEGERPNAELKEALNVRLKTFGNVRVAGRLAVPPRVMGKAAFVHLSDGIERLQIYVRKQDAVVLNNLNGAPLDGEETAWNVFKLLDHGDFIGAEGFLFLTNTGELSVHVEKFQFLAKSLLPMPDKMHGIADAEIRQRQRYADLIASSLQVEHEGLTTRQVFEIRAKVISAVRRFLEDDGYIEVETPMLTPKATGAAAKPFVTHHNALDITLYARIAPELYLKRLTVGGFEKVFELNRNFRNEGISYKHNPEFTMLEFYCAYMDVNGMMDLCEKLMRHAVEKATGGLTANYEGNEIDFGKFERLTMQDAILVQKNVIKEKLSLETANLIDNNTWITNKAFVAGLADYLNEAKVKEYQRELEPYFNENSNERKMFHPKEHKEIIKNEGWVRTAPLTFSPQNREDVDTQIWNRAFSNRENVTDEEYAKSIVQIFESYVESKLIQPTFIIDYPKSISPLSKASPENPQIAERFELFINGMEVANGFSELNDPQEQYERFMDQMNRRAGGDEEAMVLDEDYIRALSYGMPPAAGIGIGIDRLVMLLTNKHSIRDVILFPHLRPEKRQAEEQS